MEPTATALPDWEPVEHMLAALRQRLEGLTIQLAADPDGELAETAKMLRLKRGSRRSATRSTPDGS